jgi:hypothetical protein
VTVRNSRPIAKMEIIVKISVNLVATITGIGYNKDG